MPRVPAAGPVVRPPAAPAQGGGGGLLARVGGSRNGAILAAGATVGLVALLTLVRGKSSSGDSSGSDAQATPIQAYDSGPYDMWDQWEQQYDGLAGRVSTLENPPTPVPPPGSKPPSGGHTTPPPSPPASKPPAKPPTPVTPAKPPAKPPAKQTVVVKKDDTLSGIAAKYHISMATLKKLNPVYWTNPKYKQGNSIWAGDKVRVK